MSVAPLSGNGALRMGDYVISICPNRNPGPYVTASKKTFINGRLAVHLFNLSFPGRLVTGSTKVFIEGLPAGRLRDKVICGINTTASFNVFHG